MTIRSQISEIIAYGFDLMASTVSSTGAILVQIGDAVSATVDSDSAEWYQHTGFRSRPAAPTQGQSSCQGIGVRRGDYDLVFATTDNRHSAIWQDLAEDEAQMYSFGGNCRVVCRKNGKIQVITTGEVDVGSAGATVKLSGGGAAVGRVGDQVQVTFTAADAALVIAPAGTAGGPCSAVGAITLTGTITAGSSNVTSG